MKRTALRLAFFLFPGIAIAWTSNDSIDSMTGKTEFGVFAKSKNSVLLNRPYGETQARLYVRNHPRFGKAVIFAADDGQISCRSYDPCKILIRIDDHQPIAFKGLNPSDGSSNVVFIDGFAKVSKLLANGSTAIVEAEFYRSGLQRFTFDISGFSPNMLAPPKK